jgi:type I restriction enzyme M protein
MKSTEPLRKTVLDDLGSASRNIYCRFADLGNEASVETFFLSRLLYDLGYRDSQIKTKESLESLAVGRGSKRERYKPDYALCFSQ